MLSWHAIIFAFGLYFSTLSLAIFFFEKEKFYKFEINYYKIQKKNLQSLSACQRVLFETEIDDLN